ncbi:MAG: FAD-dependent oxidoreductase, partial [Planctomycetota bacterium]
EARQRSVRVVSYLSKEVTAFKQAYWAAGSYELHGRHTTRMAGASPKWALKFDSVGVAFSDRKLKDIRLSTSSFGAKLQNLWCLQEAARLKRSEMELFGDPVSAAVLGRAFGKSLVAQWGLIEASSVSGKSACGSKGASFEAEVKEQDSPQHGRNYQRQLVGPMDVPVITNCDVLVVGGGTSGATASITSAGEGMRTVLLELNPGLGGTGTFGGVNSYWFGRHVCFSSRVSTMVEQVQESIGHRPELWNLEAKSWGHEAERRLALYGDLWNIEAKMHALLCEAKKAGVEVLLNAVTIGTVMEGGKVRGVVAAGKFGPFAVLAKVVIDATGDGDVAAFAGAKYTYGSAREHAVMWYSLAQFSKPGRTRNNFTSMVDVSNIEDYTRAVIVGRRRGGALHDHGIYVASRETRHIKGGVVLTLTDELRRRQWPDVVNIHYSNCDLKGKTASDWFRTGLIPPHMEIEIPYRALLPEGLENILIAGKAISATHDGLPAIRMQADLENLGGVVALAAAQAIQQAVAPREIDLGRLQERLANMGLLAKDVLGRKIEEAQYSDAALKALVKSFDANRPLHAYSDMEMGQVYRDKIPIVEVCGGNCDRAAAIMQEVLAGADGKLAVRLAQALALCRSSAGASVLIEEIERQLEAGVLAPRTSRVRHGGIPPDQGAMPDVAYLLYSLGMTRDTRSCRVWDKVAALLSPAEEDFRDRYKGTFYYVDAVCYGAELLGEAEAVPVLSKIHAYTTLRDLVVKGKFEPDYFHERRAFLELSIGRALARCGSSEGLRILISYLDDNRGLLAEFAHTSLTALTGEDYGKDSGAWSIWLAEAGSSFKPCPLSRLVDG